MLQTEFLQRYAPTSLLLLYRPNNTGSPAHDMSEHISRFAARRTDIEETRLIGGRVIGHIEQALGPADETELQHRILTIPYAEKKLESNPNAVEFVRVIKECAGDADPRSLQIWASWAYEEIQKGLDAYDSASYCSDLSVEEHVSVEEHKARHKTNVITAVLTQLGRMAMELTAVTATNEEQLLDEPEVYEYFGVQHCYTDGADERERRTLRDHVYLEVLHKGDTTDPFTAELKSLRAQISDSTLSKTRRSDADEYKSHLADEGVRDEDLDSLVEDFERVTEQYTEDGAISLHMSDGEKFIVDGTLEEDIDENYLPRAVSEILPEIRELFLDGTRLQSQNEDDFTIARFIERQLDLIYGNRGDRDARALRTIRTVAYLPSELRPVISAIQNFVATQQSTHVAGSLNAIRKFANNELKAVYPETAQGQKSAAILANFRSVVFRMLPAIAKDSLTIDNARLYEFEEVTSVYASAEERRYVEEVLNHILENMARDFILNAQRHSKLFRSVAQAIETATDTRSLKSIIQQAFQYRTQGSLTLKLFTALRTLYKAAQARLEAEPLRSTREIKRTLKTSGLEFDQILAKYQADVDEGKLTSQEAEALAKKWARGQVFEINEPRDFIIAAPLLSLASSIKPKFLREVATAIHALPLQERERVRNHLRSTRQDLYERIKTGLARIIAHASPGKLMYLRFAFYEDRRTGAPNEARNMIHLLTEADRASTWDLLKEKSRLPEPKNA